MGAPRGFRGIYPSEPPGNPQVTPRKAPGKPLETLNRYKTATV